MHIPLFQLLRTTVDDVNEHSQSPWLNRCRPRKVGADSRNDRFAEQREQMIREIKEEVRALQDILGKSTLDDRVMEAIHQVPRHLFVPTDEVAFAYVNSPLSIGHGQTISQPFIVALMTDLLAVGEEDVVLEVGTGSGYQAAVLAQVVKRVYSIEMVADLGEQARGRLHDLGYSNVEVGIGNGRRGWPEKAPFDAIIVTAATEEIPPALVAQLDTGGRMVIPVGARYATQTLTVLEKVADGNLISRSVLPVAFVPLTA